MNQKRGLFLLNLGSPKSPSVKDVRSYLDEFLNDPYVIDLPWFFRKILVNGIILNTRPKNSAEAYHKVWTADGSPLMNNVKRLTETVKHLVEVGAKPGSEKMIVKFGMRYGEPSIATILKEFKAEGVTDLVFLPLYPQYSYAASESSIALFKKTAAKFCPEIKTRVIEDFFAESGFISSVANTMRQIVANKKPDLLLLSYHGIPERQIAKIEKAPAVCCQPGCCDQWSKQNEKCYRAQCYETTRLIAVQLGLAPSQVMTTFQSRLGRTKWIEPYTDFVLKDLPAKGIKNVLVASPSFTADCLETLEEIDIRYRELFLTSGGLHFEYVPCVNAHNDFAEFVIDLVQKKF